MPGTTTIRTQGADMSSVLAPIVVDAKRLPVVLALPYEGE
jgi:hypothetical protein